VYFEIRLRILRAVENWQWIGAMEMKKTTAVNSNWGGIKRIFFGSRTGMIFLSYSLMVLAPVTRAQADGVTIDNPPGQLQISLGGSTDNSVTVESSPAANAFTVIGTSAFGIYSSITSLKFTFQGSSQTVSLQEALLPFTTSLTSPISINGGSNFFDGVADHTNGGNSFDYSGFTGFLGNLTNYGTSSDTLIASKAANMTLTDGSLTCDAMTVSLSGVGTAYLTETGGTHEFNSAGWTGNLLLTNNSGSTLLLNSAINFSNATNNGTLVLNYSAPLITVSNMGGNGNLEMPVAGNLILIGTRASGGAGSDGGISGPGGTGGIGVSFSAVGTLTTGSGTFITGGNGGNSGTTVAGGDGGIGVFFNAAGALTTGSGTFITGGNGGNGFTNRGTNGGAGVIFNAGGTLVNQTGASISGGEGGMNSSSTFGDGGAGVAFGAGGTLVNEAGASISGGGTGYSAWSGVSFNGGTGILTNAGTINGNVLMGNHANSVTLITGGVINGDLDMSDNAGATLTLDGTGTQAYSSAVIGQTFFSGSLIKQGTGIWTLDQGLNLPGGTLIKDGALIAAINSAFSTGPVTIDSPGVAYNLGYLNGITIQNQIIFETNACIDVGDNAAATQQGVISESGGTYSLTKVGAGTLTLSGSNTYSGGTILNDGALIAGNNSAFGTGPLIINSSTSSYCLNYLNGITIQNQIIFKTNTSLYVAQNAAAIQQGVISESGGPFGLTKVGDGTLTLSGSNTYSGGTILGAGTLVVTNISALGTGFIHFMGGTLKYGAGISRDFSSQFGTESGQSYSIDTNGNDVTFETALTSSGGNLTKLGAGSLTLLGVNTYDSGTTVKAGDLQIGNATTPGSLIGHNGEPGNNGGAGVFFESSGTLTNQASSSIAGGAGGTPHIPNSGIGGAGVSFNAGGTLTNEAGASISGGKGGSTSFSNGGNGGTGISFNGSGMLTNGPGAIIAGGTGGSSDNIGGNGGTGVSFVSDGTLTNQTEASISGGDGGDGRNTVGSTGGAGVFFNGRGAVTNEARASISGGRGGASGTNFLGTGGTGGSGVVFNAGGTLTNGAGASISGGIGSTASIDFGGYGGTGVSFMNGDGTLTNETGASISGGDGGASSNNSGGNGGNGVSFNRGGTLTNEAGASISGGKGGAANRDVGMDGTGVSFAGGIGILINAGTINGGVLMGKYANSVTLIPGGVINGDLNMGPDNFQSNYQSILTLDGTGTQLYSSAVTGSTILSGSMVKQGAGTWTLDKPLDVVFGTTISGGHLNVASTLGGPVTVGAGAALGGKGVINGDVTVQNQGTLYPGDPSVTTVNGNVTLNTGATSAFFIANSATPAPPNKVTAGTDYDQVAIHDTATASNLTIQTGVTLEILNLTSLQLNSVAYVPSGSNTGLINYFVYTLQTGATSGQFDFLSDGATSQAITYSGGIGEVTLGDTELFISYNGNASANSTTGGHDVVLTAYAVPEPSAWVLMVMGAGLFSCRAGNRAGGYSWRSRVNRR
jgi:autotransporter-associated beta strand protein